MTTAMTVKKIITSIVCCAVALTALAAYAQQPAATPATATKSFRLPTMNASANPDDYPFAALKNSVQGRVLLEFLINSRGSIADISVSQSEPEGMFDSAARKTLKAVRFTVPKDWEDSGATLHRFTMSVVFKISPCPTTPCMAPKPHDTADDFLIITAAAKR